MPEFEDLYQQALEVKLTAPNASPMPWRWIWKAESRIPRGQARPVKFLAVLTVRNEAAFLLEWLAHHRGGGFTDFLVFSNDCQDGTDTCWTACRTWAG